MRVNQFVASASGLSRRAADAAITDGRVSINDKTATLGQAVEPADVIKFNGAIINLPKLHSYIVLNKPVGYVTSRAQQSDDPTIYELLPAEYKRLRPVGRLDRDSSGLLILTDDGEFIHRHTHPSFGKEKLYELKLSKPITQNDVRELEAGVMLSDGPSRVDVRKVKGSEILVAISEGRNRQLRRTFGALGHHVLRLHRLQMGPYQLGDLESGQWRELKPEAER